MATPAEIGKNKHRGLVEDARGGVGRLTRTLAEMVEELDGQRRQARPRLEVMAVLTARAVKQAVTVDGLLGEMQELVAGMRASRSEIDTLHEEMASLRALVMGFYERRGGDDCLDIDVVRGDCGDRRQPGVVGGDHDEWLTE